MTRQAFIAALFAPLAGFSFTRKPRREYLANYNAYGRTCLELAGCKCLVDGREIYNVWYVDTKERIVKSYDIDQNHGKPQVSFTGWKRKPEANPRMANWELLPDQLPVEDANGLLSITLRGRIELIAKDGRRIYG